MNYSQISNEFSSKFFELVEKANKIVVMDQGKKVEEGTHKELLKSKGIYSQMVSLQTD